MVNIGITGASGFLGSYLVSFLQRATTHRIIALTRTLRSGDASSKLIPSSSTASKIEWQQGDLASRSDCLSFTEKLDVLIHLAHTNTPLSSHRDLPGDAQANLIPTLMLLDAIRLSGRKVHVIYASSGGAVYGESSTRIPFEESDSCKPVSSYGIQKLTAEHYLRIFARERTLTATILRISNPYGMLLPSARKQGFIGIALRQICERKPVHLFGSGESVRDFIHLEDLCSAILRAFEVNKGFATYNIGSGKGHSLQEVLMALEQLVGPFRVDPSPLGKEGASLPDWNVLNIKKAERELGWKPKILFAQGLAHFYEQISSTGEAQFKEAV